jgi:hypothetical protein
MDIAFIMHKVFLTSYLPAGVLEMNTLLDHKQDVKASDEQHGLEPALNPVTHAKADTKEADEWIVVKRKRPP